MHAVLSEDEVTVMDGYSNIDSEDSVSWRGGQTASPTPPWALPTEFCISYDKGKVRDPWSRWLGLQNSPY